MKKRAIVAMSIGKPPSEASLNAGIKEKSTQKAIAPMRTSQKGHPQAVAAQAEKYAPRTIE
jgi:hypothetical protein